MVTAFKSTAELDLGKDVSATVTTEFYRELLNDVLAMGDSVMLLAGEITSYSENPPASERIHVRQDIPAGSLMKLEKHARAGYCMAVVLSNAEAGLRFLELRGYERCATTTLGSAATIKGWEAWLGRHLPDANGALVFGHDYEPVFIFERVETK